ncbi:bifunctional DNA primase/polymerase [Streptomyces sp. B1866]|uniref:bifunctional DNA primase/polymerase n=1 Tax=Streptomyces sp. B1866 TaxID=3075431 RepID=UPI00288C9DDB|nr:bifunctional DNA primase/polymerase [Streptomyces sp. B1866]MDT3396160.1 bifunctional DNA primase/polymerase [Streptomyces sp. B1866]
MTHDRTTVLLNAALTAAAHGWPVFPLRPGDKRPALHSEARCPGTGDCAAGHRKWEQRATTDPDRIHTAWSGRPFNVGIATGPAGLVVIDLDLPKSESSADTPSGVTTFEALCERAGQTVPTTRTVRTASGGTHLYFTAQPGTRLGNTAGKLGPLIDTRAWGGYVVAAGSTTTIGPYTLTDPTPPAPLPEWLYARLTARQPARSLMSLPSPSRASRYAAAALKAETTAVADAQEGTRNRTLLRAARALGRLVASGDLTRSEVEHALNAGAERAGLREYERMPVITSALNWSIAHNPQRRTA